MSDAENLQLLGILTVLQYIETLEMRQNCEPARCSPVIGPDVNQQPSEVMAPHKRRLRFAGTSRTCRPGQVIFPQSDDPCPIAGARQRDDVFARQQFLPLLNSTPMRHAAAFFLIITLLWQSFALAGQGLMLDYAGDRAHAVLHWDQAGHHHHDDGSLHVDHSDEGNRHVHGDVGGVTVAVLPAPLAVCLPNLRAAAPALGADVVLAPPFLEGPRRPPRLTA